MRWSICLSLCALTWALDGYATGPRVNRDRIPDTPDTRLESIVNALNPPELPPHPRLLLSAEGVEALKERIDRSDWARSRWEGVLENANSLLDDDVVLPPRGSNWWHWYASPTTGATLRTGERIDEWKWEHIDPVSGETFHGDPTDPSRDFDGVVLAREHSRWATGIQRLGLVYQVTGDARYAEKARSILLAYAEKYLDYPLHTTRNEPRIGGGRVGPQTLDESTWLIPVAQGADFIWDALSQQDRDALAEKLFLPAARDVILPHRIGVHNIQCWKNSAVGLVGFLLEDAELIREAIEHPDRGYRRQMTDGVSPDGSWWEGAWGYHFYTMSALWPLTEAARNAEIDLYGDAFKRMFDAPLRFAMPNLTLPAFNDSNEVNLAGRASMYELAYARYGESDYLALIGDSNRANDFALWFGEDVEADATERTWESVNYPEAGYAILARGEGENATWLCLKYGPHGGGHGHPDKLSFALYSKGRQIALDSGTARYGQPIQRSWYRTTLAHNTLVVDGESQNPATGNLLAFEPDGPVPFVTADAGDIYEGARFVRTVALLDEDLIVFLDRIEADDERVFDVAYHQAGEWEKTPPGDAWEPSDELGYRHLEDMRIAETDGAMLIGAVADGLKTAITLAANESTAVLTGTGVGDHLEDRVPIAIFRRAARKTAFAWAISLSGEAAAIEWDGETMTVHRPEGQRRRLRADADGSLTIE